MNVKDIIEGMADRAFKFSFLQGINDLYDSRDYGDTEPDYQKGLCWSPPWKESPSDPAL